MESFIIIIPAFNEEKNISGVIDDIRLHCPDAVSVVINDGSSDATGKVAREKGADVVNLPFNLGIGAAMQAGYKYAFSRGYRIAVQFDGDGQHRAEHIKTILAPIVERQADIVNGSRFLGEGRYRSGLARLVGIRILSWVISLIVRQRVSDPTSGFRAVNREVIDFYSSYYPDDYPEPEALVLLHRAGFRIAEVPVGMRERQEGKSSITPVRSLYYMIKVLLAIMVDMLKKIPKKSE